MLDYDWLCKRETPSVAAVVNPNRSGIQKVFWGTEEILIPVYTTIAAAAKTHPKADILVNFASMRSAYQSSMEAVNTKTIRTVAITAEGIRENETRDLIQAAKQNKTWLIGPATVGAIKAGEFRVGNTAGSIESIIAAKLYRPGSVGVVTVSGGMSLEVNTIVANYADGAYESIAVGGDKFPGSTLLDNILRLESDKDVKMHVVLGEIGGVAEYEIVDALKSKKIKKPLVAWITGTVAEQFKTEVQFGHANAKSGGKKESAQAKNRALKDAGAYVPSSFNDFGKLIEKVFKAEVGSKKSYSAPIDGGYQLPPLDYKQAFKEGKVRRSTTVVSSISDDRGEEPTFNKKLISDYADKPIGHLLNGLWFKGKLPHMGEEFLELCLKLTSDHGPAVATAHNAIVTARAGKNVVDSLVSGLLTIGPRHGGAIDGAARWSLSARDQGISASEFVATMKQQGRLIMGIGHRIKSAQNPDKRVSLLKKFAKSKIKNPQYLKFALKVEAETLKKKNNLILNVDGAIAVIFLDILEVSGYNQTQLLKMVDSGTLNAIFTLGRSIGIIGHVLDQKRLEQGLYRHPWDDILYI